MLLLSKNKIFSKIALWSLVVTVGIVGAAAVPRIENIISVILSRADGSTGGRLNVIIASMCMPAIPVAAFYVFRLKQVTIIMSFIAMLPILSRFRKFFGVHAYASWTGANVLVSSIGMSVLVLFIYLFMFRPAEPDRRGWMLLSSKAYWILAASGIITQFFFFPFFNAIRIAYLLVGVQFLWYLIVVAYVNKKEDAYKVIWGVVIATIISIILTRFTSGENAIALSDSTVFKRLKSLHMGSGNEYGVLLTSTLCLLPVLFIRYKNIWIRLAILMIPFFFLKTLIATGTRGAYLSALPLMFYLFVFRKKKKIVFSYIILLIIAYFLFKAQLMFYLTSRSGVSDGGRLENWVGTFKALLTWPHFVIGFGKGTFRNWAIPGALFGHETHHGFLQIWVDTGIVGFLAFIYFIFHALWKGIKKAMETYDFEQKLILSGLVLSIMSWLILFCTTKGKYTGGLLSLYLILTTELALLVALSQKEAAK